jgi:hypothetical protein
MKKVCVSVGEIIDRFSKIKDGGQDYGCKEAVEKFQDPELLNADLEFCGGILFDPQRCLGNGPYLAPRPPSFTIEPIASSVTRETFNSLIRVELTLKLEVFIHTALPKSSKENTKKKTRKMKKLNANDTENVLWKNSFNLVPLITCL